LTAWDFFACVLFLYTALKNSVAFSSLSAPTDAIVLGKEKGKRNERNKK